MLYHMYLLLVMVLRMLQLAATHSWVEEAAVVGAAGDIYGPKGYARHNSQYSANPSHNYMN